MRQPAQIPIAASASTYSSNRKDIREIEATVEAFTNELFSERKEEEKTHESKYSERDGSVAKGHAKAAIFQNGHCIVFQRRIRKLNFRGPQPKKETPYALVAHLVMASVGPYKLLKRPCQYGYSASGTRAARVQVLSTWIFDTCFSAGLITRLLRV